MGVLETTELDQFLSMTIEVGIKIDGEEEEKTESEQ